MILLVRVSVSSGMISFSEPLWLALRDLLPKLWVIWFQWLSETEIKL